MIHGEVGELAAEAEEQIGDGKHSSIGRGNAMVHLSSRRSSSCVGRRVDQATGRQQLLDALHACLHDSLTALFHLAVDALLVGRVRAVGEGGSGEQRGQREHQTLVGVAAGRVARQTSV